jgi:hypothetical protein
MIATVEEYPKARYPFRVKALPDHARSAGDVRMYSCETWEEARALDGALIDRIAALDPGGQGIPPLSKKTQIYGVLQEEQQPPAPGGGADEKGSG